MIDKFVRLQKWLNSTSSTSGKRKLWLLKDWRDLNKTRGVSRDEYLHYRMYEKPYEFRNAFLSYQQAREFWKILNPRQFACLARDKYLSHCILERASIPCANLYAYYNPECASATDTVAFDYGTLCAILQKKRVRECVVKPASDFAHGEGVFICKIVSEGEDILLFKSDGSKLPLNNFLSDVPLLFEEKIVQNNQLSEFNPSSVNTIRVMTALYPNNEVKIIATFIKIGRAGSDVDNAGAGGNVDAPIDSTTGVLYKPIAFNSWSDVVDITNHPDSGARLEGVQIEGWENLVECLKEYQGRLPYLKTIGWDVAMTCDGPLIIEMNNWWDTTGQLFIRRGWAKDVEECYNSWLNYNTVE